MNKRFVVLTLCSILGACASNGDVDQSPGALLDFATIADEIDVRYELIETRETDEPAVVAAVDH